MTLKSLIPGGRGQSLSRPDSNPFSVLQQEIDRLFDGFTRGLPNLSSAGMMPSMDLSETDKEIEITTELPGLEEKDVQLNVTNNILTVRGEKKNEREEKDKNYHLVECSYGNFARSVELPSGVNLDDIKAVMSKGVLKITVPKPTSTQAKKIEVKVA